MIEDTKKTLETIREDYMAKINAYVCSCYSKRDDAGNMHELGVYYCENGSELFETLENCTVLQLRGIVQFIERGTDFKILACNPVNHMAIAFAGMYVGIETDGYTHS